MQSGISASQELLSAFNTLVSSPSQFGLLATITSETLKPVTALPNTSSDFYSSLSSLQEHLDPKVPLYIILRKRPEGQGAFIAITYIPDNAPVRSKTLFASTRLTLVRELGSEHFAETVFVTESNELTPEGWKRHESHVAGAAPLTEEERIMQGVKEKEGEEIQGTGARRNHVVGMKMKVEDSVGKALSELGGDSGDNLVQLKIDVPTETIALASTSSIQSASDLATTISSTEPRYSLYRYAHTHQGESKAPIVFIYTCPTGSKIRERMVYASSRAWVAKYAEDEIGAAVEKKLEATNPDEITEKTLEEEFHPPQEAKQAFARPKRPGRK
ncbi:MAG: Twinfilin-1 [Cirrosporium novae-zelandiae]|nr:MAG: Twinfilin-1 [Cirrosporium novae-zelandiae]